MRQAQPWMRHRSRIPARGTDGAEARLWSHLRDNQMLGLTCERQRVISTFVVDFYIPAVRLVIEVDDVRASELQGVREDAARSVYLRALGLTVIRFSSLQVLNEIHLVLEDLHDVVEERLAGIELVRSVGLLG